MRQLTVSFDREFTPEMECLRRSGFRGPAGTGNSTDEFDAHSVYAMAYLDGGLAGMVRMTPEPPSVLQSWFHGKAPVPTGVGVVDANRSVVGERFRGLGIYKVLMLEALGWAHSQGFTHVVAAIEPTFPLRGFLKQTGCVEVGNPLSTSHPPVLTETLGQCIMWCNGDYLPRINALRDALKGALERKGLDTSGPHCFLP